MSINLTMPMKIALGAGGVGLVGGIVAERITSPDTIEQARAHDAWRPGLDDYLDRFPAPEGTRVAVDTTPAWRNAAELGLGGLVIGGIGVGVLANPPIGRITGYAATAAAGLGAGIIAGAAASWAVR